MKQRICRQAIPFVLASDKSLKKPLQTGCSPFSKGSHGADAATIQGTIFLAECFRSKICPALAALFYCIGFKGLGIGGSPTPTIEGTIVPSNYVAIIPQRERFPTIATIFRNILIV